MTVLLHRQPEAGTFRYDLSLKNLKESPEAVRGFFFSGPKSDSSLACQKNDWGPIMIQPPMAPTSARQFEVPGLDLKLSFGDWRYFSLFPAAGDKGYLQPGSDPIHLRCTSKYLPGWTTVYFPAGADAQLLGDVPQEAINQLNAMSKIEMYWGNTLTFGPKYPPDSPPEIVALDFIAGLNTMEYLGKVSRDSAYVREIREQLDILAKGAKGLVPISASPSTAVEREFDQALRISLPSFR